MANNLRLIICRAKLTVIRQQANLKLPLFRNCSIFPLLALWPIEH